LRVRLQSNHFSARTSFLPDAPKISSPYIKYVAGPRAGETETITSADVEVYRQEGEKRWGKLIPGGLFREPRFKPGTERKTLPFYENGVRKGYVDENGIQRESPAFAPGSFGGGIA
jgi:hypothetical protein